MDRSRRRGEKRGRESGCVIVQMLEGGGDKSTGMRLLIITQDDPLYLPEFFGRFLPASIDEFESVRVVLQSPFGEPLHDLIGRMLGFYGPVGFVRQGLRVARARLAERLGFARTTVPGLADAHGVQCRHADDVNAPAFCRWVREVSPDVLLSVSAPQIFSEELLEAPRLAALNVHSGPLPEYRGMMPTFWQMLDGRHEVGITVHRMAPEVDRGRAVVRGTVPVHDTDSLDDVIRRGKRRGADLALEALRKVADGDAAGEPLTGEGFYRSFPGPEDVERFRLRGYTLL